MFVAVSLLKWSGYDYDGFKTHLHVRVILQHRSQNLLVLELTPIVFGHCKHGLSTQPFQFFLLGLTQRLTNSISFLRFETGVWSHWSHEKNGWVLLFCLYPMRSVGFSLVWFWIHSASYKSLVQGWLRFFLTWALIIFAVHCLYFKDAAGMLC